MKRRALTLLVATLAYPCPAQAHPGPRMWVGIDSGKITTYAGPYPPSDPSNYTPSSIFVQPLVDEGGDTWDTDFPGFQKVPGGSIPSGTTFSYNLTGPLLWYNAGDASRCPFFESVFDRFTDTPPVPQMAVTNELFQTKYTSTGFVAGDPAFAYNGAAGDHNHLTFSLLGNGANPGDGPNGVYSVSLQLTAPGLLPSDTFYVLFGKNASADDLALAMDIKQHPRLPPDLDCDGDVDLEDFRLFEPCLMGPSAPLSTEPGLDYCPRADLDGSAHADIEDFRIFQRCFTGSDVQTQESCTR